MTKEDKKLTHRQRIKGILGVAKESAKAAPFAVVVKVIGTVISAGLPIVTTYYAALTTTALAEAYAGDSTAGERAIFYVIITAALGVVLTAWSSFEQYVDAFSKYAIDVAMNDKMYDHFLDLDYWQYDDKKIVDMFDRAKQFARYFSYVFDSLSGIFKDVVTMIFALIALSLVNWWLGLIVLIAVIPGIIIQFRLSRLQTRHWNSTVEARRARSNIEWNLLEPRAIAEIKLYGLASHLLQLRRKYRDQDEKSRLTFERQFISKRLGGDVLEAVAEVVVLTYTALQIIAKEQPIGQFLYVQQITSRAFSSLRSFVGVVNSIDEDVANLFDYREFMELPGAAHKQKRLSAMPKQIAFDNVSFTYPGAEQSVLQDISMTIRPGDRVAIVGENGAGKSTFIKLLLGLYKPTAGAVMLDGENLHTYDPASWHQYMAVLQQDFQSYTFTTARSNIVFGDVAAKYSDKKLADAAKKAEAQEFLEKLPKSYDTLMGKWMEHADGTSGVNLSGGQWQRLALARNFYRDSPIIILDEPTSAIDALAESRIFKHLFADKKRTVIAIGHRLSTVEKADTIYMFEAGRIVEQGTYEQLVKKQGRFYRMFESQIVRDIK